MKQQGSFVTNYVEDEIPPLRGLMYANVDFNAEYNNYPDLTTDIETANCITSRTWRSWNEEELALADGNDHISKSTRTHKFIADIDLPVKVIESSPGHNHLYIDKSLTWRQMVILLEAFSAAGIIEDGYVQASLERGFTALRLPWVKKETTNAL